MKLNHLGDEDIQQYVLDKAGCSESVITHISICDSCKAKVETYQLLFTGIQEQPKPVFDFDVTQLVLMQLPETKPAFDWSGIKKYAVFAIIALVVILPLYFFSRYFINILNSTPSFFIYAIAFAVIGILLYKVFEMYKKYQRQMTDLNFN